MRLTLAVHPYLSLYILVSVHVFFVFFCRDTHFSFIISTVDVSGFAHLTQLVQSFHSAVFFFIIIFLAA